MVSARVSSASRFASSDTPSGKVTPSAESCSSFCGAVSFVSLFSSSAVLPLPVMVRLVRFGRAHRAAQSSSVGSCTASSVVSSML